MVRAMFITQAIAIDEGAQRATCHQKLALRGNSLTRVIVNLGIRSRFVSLVRMRTRKVLANSSAPHMMPDDAIWGIAKCMAK